MKVVEIRKWLGKHHVLYRMGCWSCFSKKEGCGGEQANIAIEKQNRGCSKSRIG
jgi:hypothetical protein